MAFLWSSEHAVKACVLHLHVTAASEFLKMRADLHYPIHFPPIFIFQSFQVHMWREIWFPHLQSLNPLVRDWMAAQGHVVFREGDTGEVGGDNGGMPWCGLWVLTPIFSTICKAVREGYDRVKSRLRPAIAQRGEAESELSDSRTETEPPGSTPTPGWDVKLIEEHRQLYLRGRLSYQDKEQWRNWSNSM